MELQHFCHDEHPLVFSEERITEERIYDKKCWGCQELLLGPSYSCIKCKMYYHHKSCAELPIGLYHPLHPKHPLILFDEFEYRDNKEYSKCQVCKENRWEYSYRCSRCDFNLHLKCASLPRTMEVEVHDHPLTAVWKSITFNCDLCGKEDKGMPYQCNPCDFLIHRSCAISPRRVKVVRHKHPLDLIYSLEVHQSKSPFCHLCVQKVDTHYGLYYCSKCDFLAHLHCAVDNRNIEDINLWELKHSKSMLKSEDTDLLDESIYSATYDVIKTTVGEDGIEIAIEIKHFSHEHDLKLIEEIQNNEKCNGCRRAILPPFYSCVKCSFFLHKSCVELPRKKRHPLHQHPLTLLPQAPSMEKLFWCYSCDYPCNGFAYKCKDCSFYLDVQCSLVSNILTHKSHEHQLFLSITRDEQTCNGCGFKRNTVFRCITCEFALDFKCATLPLTTRYEQHEHPFTLCYTAEDDSGEYYCDICEEKRDPKHWFYYCAECSYPAHPKCIIGKYPNCKFGVAYTFNRHPHPLTFVEETKDHPPCNHCGEPCEELFYQCTQCNFNIHGTGGCIY